MKKGSVTWIPIIVLGLGIAFAMIYSYTIRLHYYQEYSIKSLDLERAIDELENWKFKLREALIRATKVAVYDVSRENAPLLRNESMKRNPSNYYLQVGNAIGNLLKKKYGLGIVKGAWVDIGSESINAYVSTDTKETKYKNATTNSKGISENIKIRLGQLYNAARNFVDDTLKKDEKSNPISFYNVTRKEAYSVFDGLRESYNFKKDERYCDPKSHQDLTCTGKGLEITEVIKRDQELPWGGEYKKPTAYGILESSNNNVKRVNPNTNKYSFLYFDITPSYAEVNTVAKLSKLESTWNCSDCYNETNINYAVCCRTRDEDEETFVCCESSMDGHSIQSSCGELTTKVDWSKCGEPCEDYCSDYDDYESDSDSCTCIDYDYYYHSEKGDSCLKGSKVNPSNCDGCDSICDSEYGSEYSDKTDSVCKCYDQINYDSCYHIQVDEDPVVYCEKEKGGTVVFRGRDDCRDLPGGSCEDGPDFKYWRFYFDYVYDVSSKSLVSIMDKCMNNGAIYKSDKFCWDPILYHFLIGYKFETGCNIHQNYEDYVECLNEDSEFNEWTDRLDISGREECTLIDPDDSDKIDKIYWAYTCKNTENLIEDLTSRVCSYSGGEIVTDHFESLIEHEIEICKECADPHTPCNTQEIDGTECGLCSRCVNERKENCVDCGNGADCGLYKDCSGGGCS